MHPPREFQKSARGTVFTRALKIYTSCPQKWTAKSTPQWLDMFQILARAVVLSCVEIYIR
jgi:hypothetical protein